MSAEVQTPEPAGPEPAAPGDPARRRILISVGSRTVEVEGPDEMDAMIFTAERMWQLAGADEDPRMWSGGMGFSAEMDPER